MSAIQSGLDVGVEIPPELAPVIIRIEESIRKRVAIGNRVGHARLCEEMTERYQDSKAVELAILNMIKSDELQQQEGRKVIVRKKWDYSLLCKI